MTCKLGCAGSARVCHVGQDLVKSGRVAAGLLVPVLSGGDVLIVCGNREFTAHRLRVEGFLDRLYELEGDIGHAHVIECIERYDLTYDGVLREVRRNPRLRAIYMANESVKGCMDALSRARAPQPIHVVCNDLTPYAREYLSDGRWISSLTRIFPDRHAVRSKCSMTSCAVTHAGRSGHTPAHEHHSRELL